MSGAGVGIDSTRGRTCVGLVLVLHCCYERLDIDGGVASPPLAAAPTIRDGGGESEIRRPIKIGWTELEEGLWPGFLCIIVGHRVPLTAMASCASRRPSDPAA